jgi:hypothetical protein
MSSGVETSLDASDVQEQSRDSSTSLEMTQDENAAVGSKEISLPVLAL